VKQTRGAALTVGAPLRRTAGDVLGRRLVTPTTETRLRHTDLHPVPHGTPPCDPSRTCCARKAGWRRLLCLSEQEPAGPLIWCPQWRSWGTDARRRRDCRNERSKQASDGSRPTRLSLVSMKEDRLSSGFAVWASGSSPGLMCASGAHLSIASSVGGPGDIGGRPRGRNSKRAVKRPDEKRRLPKQEWVQRADCW
jgi:hypothetical protein